MADLVFDCLGADPELYSATPSLSLRLRITETSGQRVEAIALRCQIRIEPQRRRYTADEAAALHDLFGDTARWADTLKPLQLASLSTMVAGFTGATTHDLPLPLTYDLEIASTKYFSALDDGVVPLLLLYSGTVFGVADGRMQVQQVPWSKESSYGLPVRTWRQCIDRHFPDRAWFSVSTQTYQALREYKTRRALPTWDSTLHALLKSVDVPKM